MTASGLHLPDGMALQDWLRVGSEISRISSASAWWLGDWLVFGEHAYRQRYKGALATTSFDYQTLRNYTWVCRRFHVSRRRDKLSFQHHSEVAALPEAEQDLWLQRAERSRWSRNEFRRQLASTRRRDPGANGPPVLLRIAVAPHRERQWREAATAAEQDLDLWVASVADQAAHAFSRGQAASDATSQILQHLED